jgi:hypothetical protein
MTLLPEILRCAPALMTSTISPRSEPRNITPICMASHSTKNNAWTFSNPVISLLHLTENPLLFLQRQQHCLILSSEKRRFYFCLFTPAFATHIRIGFIGIILEILNLPETFLWAGWHKNREFDFWERQQSVLFPTASRLTLTPNQIAMHWHLQSLAL